MRNLLTLILTASFVLTTLYVSGCEEGSMNGGTGALLGGGLGAGIGQIAGRDTKATLIGAGIGAGAGYLLGENAKAEHQRKQQQQQIQQLQDQQNSVTIWITNSNGSQQPVTLKKDGPGYIGPRGERYPSLPTEEQLRQVYGF